MSPHQDSLTGKNGLEVTNLGPHLVGDFVRPHQRGVAKVVLSSTSELFGLFAFPAFPLGTVGSLFGFLLGLGFGLGGVLFLVLGRRCRLGLALGLFLLFGRAKVFSSDFLVLGLFVE